MKKSTFLFFAILTLLFFGMDVIYADVINVSDSIKNSNFEGDAASWTTSSSTYGSFKQADGCFEAWNGANSSSWFNCFQQVTLPAGVYRLTAAAYHRGYLADITNVILFGTTSSKEYSVGIKSLQSETAAYGSTPGSMVAAKTAFNAGYWVNTVDKIIVKDEGGGVGSLKVGIRNIAQPVRATSATAGDIWTIWSNFKLYKLTGTDLDGLRDETVTKANAILAESTDYNDGGIFSNAINTLSVLADADITYESILALENAIQTYKTNRMSVTSLSKPMDVTHLIANAGFENGQNSVLGTANGHYNQPIGWLLTYNAAATHTNNNVTIINNKVVPAGVAAGVVINPGEGSYSYVGRFRWTANESASISQKVKNLMAGKYKLSAHLGKLSTNGTSVFKAQVGNSIVMNQTAAFVAGPTFTAVENTFDVLAGDSLTITATLTQVGGEATIMLDNIKLMYYGELPFISSDKSSISFTPNVRQKTFVVKAANISQDVVLASSSDFTLSRNTISAAEAINPAGVEITVNATSNTDITLDSIVMTCGSLREKISLSMMESAMNVSVAGLFFDQTLVASRDIVVTGDLYQNIVLSAPDGITLTSTTIPVSEAVAGKTVTVTWDQNTKVQDRFLRINSGLKMDSVLIFAVNDNLIAGWDGNDTEGELSRLTDFGWSQTLADGVSAGPAVFNTYNGSGGVRLVPAANAAHTYRGKTWIGHRVAYLRTWGSPATNVYNFEVNLEAGKTYYFRGVSAWHNNETNPTFTYAINSAKANLGDTLGIQSKTCTVRQQGEDYQFEVTPGTTAMYYLTVSSNTVNDAMCAPDFLAVYLKPVSTSAQEVKSVIKVYPTITDGIVWVESATENARIRVMDMSGKLIQNLVKTSDKFEVKLQNQGLYFISIEENGLTKTAKVFRK